MCCVRICWIRPAISHQLHIHYTYSDQHSDRDPQTATALIFTFDSWPSWMTAPNYTFIADRIRTSQIICISNNMYISLCVPCTHRSIIHRCATAEHNTHFNTYKATITKHTHVLHQTPSLLLLPAFASLHYTAALAYHWFSRDIWRSYQFLLSTRKYKQAAIRVHTDSGR